MASSSNSILFATFLVVVVLCCDRVYANGCYKSIISFGDSISDTGNSKHFESIYPDLEFPCGPPYGQNFIGQTTGRCSNGRLIIDFLAEILGLPLVPPFVNYPKGKRVGVVTGVNYATSGATVLEPWVLQGIYKGNVVMNSSLGAQLYWFKESLPSICGNPSDCRNFIGNALIVMGEIGCNDYNYLLTGGMQIEEVKPLVPVVIDTMISAVNDLIGMGARAIVVPGNFPFGCFPAVYKLYAVEGDEYDPITGCLIKFNEFSEYHNKMLQTKLIQTQELNPNTTIIYADFYNAGLQVYLSPEKYGFTSEGTYKACCGGGGEFNFDMTIGCGNPAMTLCEEPDTYVSWDGIHLSEAANRIIAEGLFRGPYTKPRFNTLCPTSSTSQTRGGLSSSI